MIHKIILVSVLALHSFSVEAVSCKRLLNTAGQDKFDISILHQKDLVLQEQPHLQSLFKKAVQEGFLYSDFYYSHMSLIERSLIKYDKDGWEVFNHMTLKEYSFEELQTLAEGLYEVMSRNAFTGYGMPLGAKEMLTEMDPETTILLLLQSLVVLSKMKERLYYGDGSDNLKDIANSATEIFLQGAFGLSLIPLIAAFTPISERDFFVLALAVYGPTSAGVLSSIGVVLGAQKIVNAKGMSKLRRAKRKMQREGIKRVESGLPVLKFTLEEIKAAIKDSQEYLNQYGIGPSIFL